MALSKAELARMAEQAARARAAKQGGQHGNAVAQAFKRGEVPVGENGEVLVATQASNRSEANLAKVNYTHEAMADLIIATPGITQRELAAKFGYTEGWVCRVIQSDAFQAFVAERKDKLIDPMLRGAVEESMKGLVMQSIAKLQKRLEGNPSDDLLVGTLGIATKALGYGARSGPTVQIQQNFVAVVPEKAKSTAEWAERVAERAG